MSSLIVQIAGCGLANSSKSPASYFPASSIIWEVNVSKKVKGFMWTTTVEKVNTLDNLQVQHPNKALSPILCMMCLEEETGSHSDICFLHCGRGCWIFVAKLFGIKGESWSCLLLF